MIFLLVIGALIVLLVGGFLWASGGQYLPAALGSGIIEAIPDAMETQPSPPAGALGIVSCRLGYSLGRERSGTEPSPSASVICDRLDQVIETIVSSGADIVFLQEVDFASQRTHDIDQLYYISAALGWGYAARATTWECRYFPNDWPWRRPDGRVRAGIGVISRYPLVQNIRQRLPQAPTGQRLISRLLPRPVVQMVDVQCGNTVLRLVQADFGWPHRQSFPRQLQALLAFVQDVQTPTSLLMGFASTSDPSLLWTQIESELGDRFRLIGQDGHVSSDSASSSLVAPALVGAGLSVLDSQVVTVDEPLSHEPPQLLRLRWGLPVMGMNGSS